MKKTQQLFLNLRVMSYHPVQTKKQRYQGQSADDRCSHVLSSIGFPGYGISPQVPGSAGWSAGRRLFPVYRDPLLPVLLPAHPADGALAVPDPPAPGGGLPQRCLCPVCRHGLWKAQAGPGAFPQKDGGGGRGRLCRRGGLYRGVRRRAPVRLPGTGELSVSAGELRI